MTFALSSLVVIPLVSALLLALCARFRVGLFVCRALAALGALVTLGVAGTFVASFDVTRTGFQSVEANSWIPALGIDFLFGIDGLSVGLIGAVAALSFLIILGTERREQGFAGQLCLLLLCEASALGCLISLNLVVFIICGEFLTLALAAFIGSSGRGECHVVASRYAMRGAVGSLLIAVAVAVAGVALFDRTGIWSFNLLAVPGASPLAQLAVPTESVWNAQFLDARIWLVALVLGVGLRVPFVPFHANVRDLVACAPPAALAWIVAIALPIGIYTLLRVAVPLFPEASAQGAPWVSWFAVAGLVYSVALACAQSQLRGLVFVTSLAYGAFALLGIFTFNVQGWNGATVFTVTHVLTSGMLMLLVGMLETRRETSAIADFGGIARPMPVFGFFLLVAGFAFVGLPLFAGFISQMLLAFGAFLANPRLAAVALLAMIVLAGVWVRSIRRVLLGPIDRDENRSLIDLGVREKSALALALLMILWMGLAPRPLLRRVEPSVIETLDRVQDVVPRAGDLVDPGS